ncbi:hypothetical protein GCM10009627_18980 [Curtobacterium herbarum]|uniref:Uncharacterized protein n=1 Tax=Curtobacterium herbarum TaxID=150122 RepID=A0ABN1ZD78_9MICO
MTDEDEPSLPTEIAVSEIAVIDPSAASFVSTVCSTRDGFSTVWSDEVHPESTRAAAPAIATTASARPLFVRTPGCSMRNDIDDRPPQEPTSDSILAG